MTKPAIDWPLYIRISLLAQSMSISSGEAKTLTGEEVEEFNRQLKLASYALERIEGIKNVARARFIKKLKRSPEYVGGLIRFSPTYSCKSRFSPRIQKQESEFPK